MNSLQIKIAALLLSASSLTFAQSLDEAKALYQKGEYTKAKELFAKLLKSNRRDPILNQYAAICQGEIYFGNYQFDESAMLFKKGVDETKGDPTLNSKATKRLTQSETASRMLHGIEKVQIIDSVVVNKATFMQAYHLSSESGSVEGYDQYFSKTSGSFSSVFQNQRKDKIYFAEKTDGKGYQLFTQNRLMDTWGDKIQLAESINTPANENFPFVLSDGTTLYFASDGEGSIGGYDIFVTRYNLANDNFLAPENVGMPFNSVYNDYLLAIDEQNNVGWFASDRFQPKDKVVIYIFIPNENKVVYENESPEKLTQLALIRNIKDTWIEGANYSAILSRIYNMNLSSAEVRDPEKVFRLVINDNLIYHTWSDFKSSEAKSAYRESLAKADQLATEKKKLNELRNEFISAAQTQREEIASAILTLEKITENLQFQQKELELKSVNIENQNLK